MPKLRIVNAALNVRKGPKSKAVDAGHTKDCAIFKDKDFSPSACNCGVKIKLD